MEEKAFKGFYLNKMEDTLARKNSYTSSTMPLGFLSNDHKLYMASESFQNLLSLNPKDLNQSFNRQLKYNNITLHNLLKGDHHTVLELNVMKLEHERSNQCIRLQFYKGGEGYEVFAENITKAKMELDLALKAKRVAKVGSWHVDLEQQTVYWSQVTRDIHEVKEDFQPDLESGINFYKEGIHRQLITEKVYDCITRGTPFDVELIIITQKGNEKWVRAIGEPDYLEDNIIGFYGVFQDIDYQKRKSLQADSLQHRMQLALDTSNIGIWDLDIKNNILSWDIRTAELFELPEDRLEGKANSWQKHLHPEDLERISDFIYRSVTEGVPFSAEYRIVKPKTGNTGYFITKSSIIKDSDGKPERMVGANMEITWLKEQAKKLKTLLKVTENQNKKLLNFAHIVSHNLRANSSNISMLCGMMKQNVSPEMNDKFMDMMITSSEKLDETINQLNEIIKIRETELSELVPVEVSKVLDSVFGSVNVLLERESPTIKIDIDKDLKIKGIEPFLHSILLNLLTNSIKYRSLERPLEIEIVGTRKGEMVELTFQDNGLGLDMKIYGEKLFGLYKTFHGNDDAKGVGLFLSKNQIEAMQGTLTAESELDKGMKFVMKFDNQTF